MLLWHRNRCRSEYYERENDDYLWERRGRRARSAACDFEQRLEVERDDFRHGDVESGRRRLRRLRTVDDTVKPYRYVCYMNLVKYLHQVRIFILQSKTINSAYALQTPSPDRDDWSDVVAVAPRRSRPPGAI